MNPEETIFETEKLIQNGATRLIDAIKLQMCKCSNQDESELHISVRFCLSNHARDILTIVRKYFESHNWGIKISPTEYSGDEQFCEFKLMPKYSFPPSLCKMIAVEALVRGGLDRSVYLMEHSEGAQWPILVKYAFCHGTWETLKILGNGATEDIEEIVAKLKNVKKLEFKQDSRVPTVLAAWLETYHGE